MGGRKQGVVVKWLLKFYSSATSERHPGRNPNPKKRPTVAIADIMEYIKGLPKTVKTTHQLRAHIAAKVKKEFDKPGGTIRTVVVCCDRRGLVSKRIHTHATRDKGYDVTSGYEDDDSSYDPDASESQSLSRSGSDTSGLDEEEDARYHVVVDGNSHPLPPDWSKYCRMRSRVRREVYPLIMQALSDETYMPLERNQVIVTSGLPFAIGEEKVWVDGHMYHTMFPMDVSITREIEELDPDIYSRGGIIRRHKEMHKPMVTIRLHAPDYDNTIWEADLQIPFFLSKFEDQNCVVRANDRDFVPITLMHSIDRRDNGKFINSVYLEIPNKTKQSRTTRAATYVDVNELYDLIDQDSDMAPGVYHRVLTLVFLIIMVGCDHTRKGFLKGLHPVKHVIETFYAHSKQYGHMIQLSKILVRDPWAIRVPVVDERVAIEFVNRCYMTKFGTLTAKRKQEQYEKVVRKVERINKRRRKELEKARQVKAKAEAKRRKKEGGHTAAAGYVYPSDEEEEDDPSLFVAVPEKPSAKPSRADVRKHIVRKDADCRLPKRNLTRRDIRYCTHTVIYYADAGRDQSLFEENGRFDYLKIGHDGSPYWGYTKDEETGEIVEADFVSPNQCLDEVPEAYIRHMKQKKPKKRKSSQPLQRDTRKERLAESMQSTYGAIGVSL